MTKRPVMLVVLDGWGNAPEGPANAISCARTPVWDRLTTAFPTTEIAAHGRAVGLPSGQMGNSEVGHLNLGAGRVVMQDLVRINDAIENGTFAQNQVLRDAIDAVRAARGRMHIIGLCSPGGVHSSLDHLYALVDLFSDNGVETFVHAITDGRDTPPSSAAEFLADIEGRIAGKARIATVVGRFWAMDRDKRWDRVSRGYHAFCAGEGTPAADVASAVSAAYADGQTDEFIEPRIIVDASGAPVGTIRDGDAVVFFNFRADRAREITMALAFDAFDGFERRVRPRLSRYVCMTEYQADFGLPIAFPPESMRNILGEVLQNNGMRQFRCAETEKYAHVTFFFNGGSETPFDGEDRKLVPSPKEVPTYDHKPQMSAPQVADAVLEALDSDRYDFVLVNFANPDMVGHTGIMEAAVAAIETVDAQLGRVVEAMRAKGGVVIVTADHGNAEQMRDPKTGEPHTAHTNNPVPVIFIDDDRTDVRLRTGGSLRDIAPTVLDVMGLAVPAEMTGTSLLSD